MNTETIQADDRMSITTEIDPNFNKFRIEVTEALKETLKTGQDCTIMLSMVKAGQNPQMLTWGKAYMLEALITILNEFDQKSIRPHMQAAREEWEAEQKAKKEGLN